MAAFGQRGAMGQAGARPAGGGGNPRLDAHLQQQQQAAQDRQSRVNAASQQQASLPNFREGVTPGMSDSQARFTQADAYRNSQPGQQAQGGGAYAAYSPQGGMQGGGPYAAYGPQSPVASNTPRTPPPGAQRNDLSGPVGYNLWGAQAANQIGQGLGAQPYQSFTLPGMAQSTNMLTGQPRSEPVQNWDGNLAYQPASNRPGPVSWNTTGMDGTNYSGSQGWQQMAAQRDAFSQNIIDRLGQYQGGGQTGQPSFDFAAMLDQANKTLSAGNWRNPFSDPRAQTPQPDMFQQQYNPNVQGGSQSPTMAPLSPPSSPPPLDPGAYPDRLPDGRQPWNEWNDALPLPLMRRSRGLNRFGQEVFYESDPAIYTAETLPTTTNYLEPPLVKTPDGRWVDGPLGGQNARGIPPANNNGQDGQPGYNFPFEGYGDDVLRLPEPPPGLPSFGGAQGIPPRSMGQPYDPQNASPSLPPVPMFSGWRAKEGKLSRRAQPYAPRPGMVY
jgi:hypothetical protein